MSFQIFLVVVEDSHRRTKSPAAAAAAVGGGKAHRIIYNKVWLQVGQSAPATGGTDAALVLSLFARSDVPMCHTIL